MVENIRIIDDFFQTEELHKIIEFFNRTEWNCLCMNDSNMDLSDDKPFWRNELENKIIFNDYLKQKLEKEINKKIILVRMYSVGQMYAQDGNYHEDSKNKDETTFVLYINPNLKKRGIHERDGAFRGNSGEDECLRENLTSYKEDNGGHFIVKIPQDNTILAIEPYYNRGVLFPSHYRHKGMGYSRNLADFRICIAWKFKIIT